MPTTDTSSELRAALGLLHQRIAAGFIGSSVAGLSVAVVLGGDCIFAEGFGQADIAADRPATAETIYAVGSITKLFTATMLMQLRDEGRLRLDDPVQTILPELNIPHRHPGHPVITLRHLVTHTSGLAKDAPAGYWAGTHVPPVEELMRLLERTEQPFPPGTQWKYSNLGIAILGQALARIAGQSWDSWIAERILAPLGMSASAPRLSPAQHGQRAQGYARPVDGWPPRALAHHDLGGISAGGSLHAPVTDMARFIANQFADEPKLLSRATLREMHRVQWLGENWQWGQGIGWQTHRAADGSTRIEHGGGVYGFTCRVLLSPVDRLGVAVFTNGSDSTVGAAISTEALNLLAPILRRGIPAEPAPVTSPAWHRYLGHYRWVLGDMEIALRDDALVMLNRNVMLARSASGIETVGLVPSGEHRFRLLGSQVIGEELRFTTDDTGAVTGAWVGPHPHVKL